MESSQVSDAIAELVSGFRISLQEYPWYGDLVDDHDVVRELSGVYDQLHAQALDEGSSLDMISGLIERRERRPDAGAGWPCVAEVDVLGE
jgi:hypothetical protein